jgi:origin recognition complex subunit 2
MARLNEEDDEQLVTNADRSARRKSARRIFQPAIDESEDESLLVNNILSANEDDSADEDSAGDVVNNGPAASTPKRRGRKRKAVEPESPPSHLTANERYFWDNKPGTNKTSDKVLPPNLLLGHDEFFAQRDAWEDQHQSSREFLQELHEQSFHQWTYELRNDFNVCLYGYGSKRATLAAFAEYLHEEDEDASIVVINGYRSDITLNDILTTVASIFIPSSVKLPAPGALLSFILETLDAKPPKSSICLLVHSIDAAALRRGNAAQTALASLAAHPSIRLVATADMPNFLQMWDTSLKTRFHFLFHDCTTFVPFDVETDAVESVNELLGRSGRRLGGRDGVGYVLKSLPENARQLFRILVAEQISAVADDAHASVNQGIEYRLLYQRAKEELVCSTEHQLNNLLKEFYDHQMVESRRDTLGVEWVYVPFRKEELEALLEDLVD